MTQNGSAALVTTAEHRDDYEGLSLAVAPAEAKRRVQELQAFISSVMVKEVDYGTIPGTDKPTLLQPGAQKLAEIYGLVPHFEAVDAVKDWERGFFYFEYRCILSSRRDGSAVGEGIGSCNSRESKYAGRWVAKADVPPGMTIEALQKRTGARWAFASDLPPGFDRRSAQTQTRTSKKGGEYTVFRIVDEQFLVPNPDPYSLVNTMQKMAAKRAYIHAVIGATRSAGFFTQDVEDLPPEAFGKAEAARSWEHDEAPPEAKPEHPPPAAATPAPTASPAVEALFTQRKAELTGCSGHTTDVAWKKVVAKIGDDVKRALLTLEQAATLKDVAKQIKLVIKSNAEQAAKELDGPHPAAPGDPADDFPASMGGKGRDWRAEADALKQAAADAGSDHEALGRVRGAILAFAKDGPPDLADELWRLFTMVSGQKRPPTREEADGPPPDDYADPDAGP